MKHVLIAILFIALAVPCSAQWTYDQTNLQVFAFGAHDTSLFYSEDHNLFRVNPDGYADTGINFNYGNITSFDSLGRYFFANVESSAPSASVTTDNGSHWQELFERPIYSNGYYLFGNYPVLVGTKVLYHIVLSRDSGVSWDSVSSFGNGYPVIYATMGSTLYGTVNGAQFWRSLDTGHTWSQLSPPFVGTMMTMGSVLFIYPGLGGNNGLLIESRDSGKDWDTVHVDSAGVPEYVTCLATDGKNLFAGGIDSRIIGSGLIANGVYVSSDTGKTWRAENQGLGFLYIEALGVYDTLLYASTENTIGTDYATYHRPIHEMTDTTQSMVVQTAPPSDSIEIYPNPASGTVTILAGGSSVLGVSMLNVLGEDVLDIPNSYSSTLSFDVSRLASGTYFVRIQTAAGTVLKKITLERS